MTDSVLTYLDGYCERAGALGVMAEPLNLVTNVFFIIAAVLAGRALLRAQGQGKPIDLWLLVASLFAIGIGSGLWHAAPSGTTVLMDVIPITLFINIFIITALRHLFALRWRRVLCWWGLYVMLTLAGQIYLSPNLLHGTVMYLPTYAALVGLVFGLARRDRDTARIFMLATSVWSVSLILRTVDLEICSQLSIGTHFLWHTLNAWVLWRLLMVLIEKRTA